jgi:hypothetical protein
MMKTSPPPITPKLQKDLIWVDRVAWLMDEKFKLKGTKFRFGLDPLINLIPFLGDIIGFGVSAVLVFVMWRNGASRKLVILMSLNIIADLTIGAIPIIGNVFDFFFKANSKNIRLLRAYYYEGKYQGKGNDVWAWLFGIILFLTLLFLYLLWQGLVWMIQLF